ncbi:heterokaryon incompatibility protein Het-C-domain-containing protein [Podospora appendiculata]|uniref:Heterokaryon incompatibility protein Het-C-domain-containing protein n=1 Tax=Podospora appendiculata TaxID=314037 RepID=A0AAE0X377_9PEZI|nr:heterokaryon incompatibility protein Het-C-domain-containing protein [Podospora appendiculata]
MAGLNMGSGSMLLIFALVLLVLPGKATAFGAGNIPSIAQVEGHNWRHGDIEDVLKTLAFLHGKKWTTMLVSRTYFGNWLRDYSQAVDVGSLKGVNAATIRILVWVLSFLANGYATQEFEVTEDRLGVYRPEEHIDNPLGYADGEDARKYDPRLRGPVDPRELEIDPRTGMKNYIANESGGWATSAGYLRFSFARSIHFGRVYTSGGHGQSGKEADLCEALRCLGQALHCMEDFSAHSNYVELALIELGHRQVFPHCGTSTEITLRGRRVYPLVTGTFGAVDFLHSVLGEATDHFTQSEVDEMNIALKNAEQATKSAGLGGSSDGGGLFGFAGFGGFGSSSGGGSDFISLVSKLPSVGDGFASQARDLKEASAAQEQENARSGATNPNHVPGMSDSFDPVATAKKIYPILEFRDNIVRSISNLIAKIPGLESLLEKISETLTAFIMGLLAPFVRPIITQVSKTLKEGSSGLINSSAKSQLEPWTNSRCDNPTHSMLSKDHFTNILNAPAGQIAGVILQYVVPRVIYAWENPGVPVDELVNDVLRAFHHPANRDENIQIQRDMFATVRNWVNETPLRSRLDHMLSSESVKNGKNHILPDDSKTGSSNRSGPGGGGGHSCHDGGHGRPTTSLWSQLQTRDLDSSSPPPQQQHHHQQVQQQYHSRPTSSGYGGSTSPGPQHQSPSYGYGGPQGPQGYGQGGGGGGGGGYSGQGGYGSQPAYGGEQSLYGGGQPPYGGGQPAYGGSQPGYGGGQPGYGGGQPPYGAQPPYGGGPPYGQPPPPGPGGWQGGPPQYGGGYGGGSPPPAQYPPYQQPPPWGGPRY